MFLVCLFISWEIVARIIEELLFAGTGGNVEEVKAAVEVSVPYNQEGICTPVNFQVDEIPETREKDFPTLSGASCCSHFQYCKVNSVDEFRKLQQLMFKLL